MKRWENDEQILMRLNHEWEGNGDSQVTYHLIGCQFGAIKLAVFYVMV